MANDRLRGLLSFDPDDPNSQGLLGLGAALLQASGPSREPVGMGQALGQGLQGMQQARQQAIQQQMMAARMNAPSVDPSSVAEWKYFSGLSKKEQERYLEMKRNPNIMNLGDRLSVRSPGGGISESYDVNLKPGDLPEVRGAQARAGVVGKAAGENDALLADMEASFPRLEQVASDLSTLGKRATYTKTGQARDFIVQETGFGSTEGATARKEYIAKVDNEVLPLLRQTFGAAFTQKEGESLKATLGDPNVPPEQKDAVLRAFIDTKRAQIETQKRRVGIAPKPVSQNPSGSGGPQNVNGVITVDW